MEFLTNYKDVDGNHFEVGDKFKGNKGLKDSLLDRGIIGGIEVEVDAGAEANTTKKEPVKRKPRVKKEEA